MRVCLLPSDTWGVGSYRTLFPGRELEKRGHEIFAHLDRAYLARWNPREGNVPLANALSFEPGGRVSRTFDADSYVFQRRMEKFAPAAIRVLRAQGKHTVYELDDNYDELPESSPGQRILRRHPDRLRVEWMNEAISEADVVTVSTPALRAHYSQYSDNVVVLPNYLDWEMWRDVPLQFEEERPRVRVGWMGWLEWRGRDLERLRPWLHDWLLAHPSVDFVSIGERHGNAKYLRKHGHVTVHDYLDVPKAQRVTVKAAPFRDLAKITASCDIGLVPLEANAFNECKSHLKGLEYSACGVVPVASPSGPYQEFIEHGVNGFLCDSPSEWMEVLDDLVSDAELRHAVAREARRVASENTIQREWRRWEQAWQPASTLEQAQTVSLVGSTSTTELTTTSGALSSRETTSLLTPSNIWTP